MDQLLTYILSAVGILGFFLAGRKVWWAWYVNIANQVLWTVFSVITQQWGFLLAAGFYSVVFSINAYKWTKDHLIISKNPIGFVETRHEPGTPAGVKVVPVKANSKHSTMGMRWGYMKPPAETEVVGYIKENEYGLVVDSIPPEETRQEQMTRFMRVDGTDAAISNEIAHAVTDVMKASTGEDYVDFSLRYSIAGEVQRRLDVKLKGTRPDDKVRILAAIYQIDNVTKQTIPNVNQVAQPNDISRMTYALGFAKNTLQDLLKGK